MRETAAAGKKLPTPFEFRLACLETKFLNTGCLVGEDFQDAGEI